MFMFLLMRERIGQCQVQCRIILFCYHPVFSLYISLFLNHSHYPTITQFISQLSPWLGEFVVAQCDYQRTAWLSFSRHFVQDHLPISPPLTSKMIMNNNKFNCSLFCLAFIFLLPISSVFDLFYFSFTPISVGIWPRSPHRCWRCNGCFVVFYLHLALTTFPWHVRFAGREWERLGRMSWACGVVLTSPLSLLPLPPWCASQAHKTHLLFETCFLVISWSLSRFDLYSVSPICTVPKPHVSVTLGCE